MTSTLIDPTRLAKLDELALDNGSHTDVDDGLCFNEAAAWLAGEKHSDAPRCVSPVLRRYTMRLNDRWSDDKRQLLKPYLVRVIGTAGDGKDDLREQVATRYLSEHLLEPWLRLAGMDTELAKLNDLTAASTVDQRRQVLWSIREAAWAARRASRAQLADKIKAHWAKTGTAVADADAVDVVDVAAAVVAAVAVAVADAVADAVAVAVAADAADAADGVKPDMVWSKAYSAARTYFAEHPLPVMDQIAEIGASQNGAALDLLELMIDPAGAR